MCRNIRHIVGDRSFFYSPGVHCATPISPKPSGSLFVPEPAVQTVPDRLRLGQHTGQLFDRESSGRAEASCIRVYAD
jgi:hypothetical protein